MFFCSKCGTQLPNGAKHCPSCGEAVNTANNLNNGNTGANGGNSINDLLNTPDMTAEFDAADIEQNKLFALLSYLSILFLVPILAAPNSKFARFHANQGLVLFIVDIALPIVAGSVSAIIFFIPFIGVIIAGIIGTAAGLVSLLFTILGVVNAAQGKAKELPIIGKLKILK